MQIQRKLVVDPYFSICIPQFNRTSLVIEACKSLAGQTFKNFQVCIADDCSTDGKEQQLLEYLNHSGMSYAYHRQARNVRYDANLRASIALSDGRYCFLLGNDDALVSAKTLEDVYKQIQQFGPVGVVISNFENFASGEKVRRIKLTEVVGAGPAVAANSYRNMSFVSGMVLDGPWARRLQTAKWDGSEMYQMFLGCRIIAAGGRLLVTDAVTIRKDIRMPGEPVDSYATKPRLNPCPISERKLPMVAIGQLVADAIGPYLPAAMGPRMMEKVLLQLFLFTYPFWLFEFRRVQSWNYAAGVCFGMRPTNACHGLRLDSIGRLRLKTAYALMSFLGLCVPLRVFDLLRPALYSLAKSMFKAAS